MTVSLPLITSGPDLFCSFFFLTLKLKWTQQRSCLTTAAPASDLVPQTEVEAVQLDKGGGLDGGLLFELLLPALRWEAGPGHHVTQRAVGAAPEAALQVDGVSCDFWDDHWCRWTGRLLCWQERSRNIWYFMHNCRENKANRSVFFYEISKSKCSMNSCRYSARTVLCVDTWDGQSQKPEFYCLNQVNENILQLWFLFHLCQLPKTCPGVIHDLAEGRRHGDEAQRTPGHMLSSLRGAVRGPDGAFLTTWQLPDLLIVLVFDLTRGDKRKP